MKDAAVRDLAGRFVLWGSAGHAKVLADVIGLHQGQVVALFDNNPHAQSCLKDVPLYLGLAGLDAWLKAQISIEGLYAGVAIGGARGRDRLMIAQSLQDAGLLLPLLAHPRASISPTAQIGQGSQVLANAVVAADVVMGKACIVNNNANVDHECVLGDGVHIAPGAVLCGCVTVEENTMVGARAVVLPRLRIGRNVVVGAGAVVTRDVPDDSVVVGNPARLLGAKND
ncbi:NeuD/PglB/VioB family sugar acetyltransferase [Rhodoferax saidenbachensis]|uniref:Sugar O-acyltransferase (Sialic acid O-acetyltransferase NeuD family) n=1 Tax=Rhodoferax saidenbachensis TaxID=1484693 RepID=A0ABU1ZTJ7_9BURK|nr:NeuD/PglB/VioB family sugar acetyltransferase [Rhodoferax saidenbachensis]MDR7308887.1 sugar O-acyltransferase (sialic acid O-acetyltransferase NeuD family) [Rhodoferax saidenbachensis]